MATLSRPDTTLPVFQQLLDQVRRDGGLLEQPDNGDETPHAPSPVGWRGGPAPAPPAISDSAIELIITFKVSSREVYESKYRHPIWPQGRSGITVGIGYDVGYVTRLALARDWNAKLAPADLAGLAQACGVTGSSAGALLPRLAHIDIPYVDAHAVFTGVSIAGYTQLTVASLANTDALHPDCLGALVSLVYNRGASFEREGERYREMRAIRAAMEAQTFSQIPAQIRGMKRIWADEAHSAGLLKRRELEALLFEHGLAQV